MGGGSFTAELYAPITFNRNNSYFDRKSPHMGDCVEAFDVPLSKCKVEKLPGPSE
jgi:hypothetical protein